MSAVDHSLVKAQLLDQFYQHCLSFFGATNTACQVDGMSAESFRKHLVEVNNRFHQHVKPLEAQVVSELIELPGNKLSVFEANRLIKRLASQAFDAGFYKNPSVDRLLKLIVEDNRALQELLSRQVQVDGVTYVAREVIDLPGSHDRLWVMEIDGRLRVATSKGEAKVWVDRDYLLEQINRYQDAVNRCQGVVRAIGDYF